MSILVRLVAAFAAAATLVSAAAADEVNIRTRMIEDFGGGPEAAGRLDFLGGLVMTGPAEFGALSGVLVEADRLLAVSDTGKWFTARLVRAGGRPLALEDAELWPRRDDTGRPIRGKSAADADAEALTRVDGAVLVAVEGSAKVLRYPAKGIVVDREATASRVEVPLKLLQAARRSGFEALATTADGTVVAAVEGNAKSGPALAFRLGGAPFAIARDRGWSVTGADTLPGGDMVIVERHWGGGIDIGMRVRRIGLWDVAEATGTVDGPVLLEAGFASQIDNMEAIAASEEDGRTVLTVLSDDNMSFLQRSLLLRFAIRDPLPRRKPDRTQAGLWPDRAPDAVSDGATAGM